MLAFASYLGPMAIRLGGSRPTIDLALHDVGPFLWVHVWYDEIAPERNRTPPSKAPVRVAAIIDTGATQTLVDLSVCRELGIDPLPTSVPLTTLNDTETVQIPSFRISVILPTKPQAIERTSIIVGGVDMLSKAHTDPPMLLVIGRDILNASKFTYDGKAKRMLWEF